MSGQQVLLLFNHLYPKRSFSSQGPEWSTSVYLLFFRGVKRLEREERCSQEKEEKSEYQKEKQGKTITTTHIQICQQWNLPNVYSHITINITKIFHHFCFRQIYSFFLQTIKYIVTRRCKCRDAKYLIIFGAHKTLIMQLAPQSPNEQQKAFINNNNGTRS